MSKKKTRLPKGMKIYAEAGSIDGNTLVICKGRAWHCVRGYEEEGIKKLAKGGGWPLSFNEVPLGNQIIR